MNLGDALGEAKEDLIRRTEIFKKLATKETRKRRDAERSRAFNSGAIIRYKHGK